MIKLVWIVSHKIWKSYQPQFLFINKIITFFIVSIIIKWKSWFKQILLIFFLCWVDAQLKVGVIIFGSVQFLSKKNKQTEFFLKKTKTKPKPVQTDRFRFGFLGQKPVQTGLSHFFSLARLFPIWLCFFGLARFFRFGSVFSVWLGFFRFFRFRFDSVFSKF